MSLTRVKLIIKQRCEAADTLHYTVFGCRTFYERIRSYYGLTENDGHEIGGQGIYIV